MQEIELALIVGSALALLVALAVRFRGPLGRRPIVIGALLGILPGILGAIVVLVPRTDLVPDAAEPYVWLTIALVASGIALLALSQAVARR